MNGRERTRLRRAREDGFLDASCKDNRALLDAYGLWCWRLKIPMVWLERRTPHSRYARVQLEMFTSSNRLTPVGQVGIEGICAPGNSARFTQVSAHDARWDRVAMSNTRELARAVLRAAVRPENYERNEATVEQTKAGKFLRMA